MKLTVCNWRVLLALFVLLGVSVDGVYAQRRPAAKRPAARRPAPRPAAPKSPLPKIESPPKIEVAPVDPARLTEAQRSADEIDRLVMENLKSRGLSPNPSTSDEQFVRRVYLDIVGRIPTSREAQLFTRTSDPQKRVRLIDRLLNSPGYASHFYNYWADILRLVDRADNNTYIRPYSEWVKQCLRDNTPFDDMVVQMLTATGKAWENPAAGYLLRDPGMPLDNLNNTVQVFLGTRIGCAQCHNHPFDRWTQREFYELAAFMYGVQTSVPNRAPRGVTAPTTIQVGYNDLPAPDTREGRVARSLFRLNRRGVWENPYRPLKFPHDYSYDDAKPNDVVTPKVIFGETPDLPKQASRREAFARWMTSPENPRFALTLANRLWKRAFGVGLIEPVDDLRDDTVASNPELMEYLVAEMKRLDFDMKEFQRIIFLTETYQRQATMTDLDPAEPYHFPGPVLRRMTAEQVWDSLLTLTLEDPDAFLRPSDEQFVAAIDLTAESTTAELMQKIEAEQAARTEERKVIRQRTYKGIELARASELPQPLPAGHFLREFGQSDRQVIGDSTTDGAVPQLLTMFNGPVTHMMLEEGSVIYNVVTSQRTVGDMVDTIFLCLLSRRPTAKEKQIAENEINTHKAAGAGNVIWSLLNTREFLFVQ